MEMDIDVGGELGGRRGSGGGGKGEGRADRAAAKAEAVTRAEASGEASGWRVVDGANIDSQEAWEAAAGSTSWDYVVIGAGSAGSVAAGRLADAGAQVLLLEAGPRVGPSSPVWDPNQINCLYDIDEIHWVGYRTVPQPNLGNQAFDYPRARMTGGCSGHNDMVYARGARGDYDGWATNYGCNGWSYKNVVGYFQEVEGRIGPTTTDRNPFGDAYVQSAEGLGFPWNPDYNSGADMYGVSPMRSTITAPQGGTRYRETSFVAYGDGGGTVATSALVDKIVVEGGRVRAVNLLINSVPIQVGVGQEVVLSGGAMNNPGILLRSGIGDPDQLKALGVPVVTALPGVGKNFMDALIMAGHWKAKKPIEGQATNLGYAILWANPDDTGRCQHAIEMTRGLYWCDQTPDELTGFYTLTADMMNLQSRGMVSITSTDPRALPVIDPQYLTAPGDLEQCLAGFELMRRVGNAPGLEVWREFETVPGPRVDTPAKIEEWVRTHTFPMSHASGTCAMGDEPLSVVDPSLRVYGVNGLRVADVSIMPRIVAAHTQGPAFMIGARVADFLLGRG